MTARLFVYGTLAPGHPNEHVLAGVPGEWQPASVRGELLHEGWGAAVGFPGIVIDEQGPEVRGQLFSSEDLPRHWQRLDEFEGDGYDRVLTTTTLRGGRTAEAYSTCFEERLVAVQVVVRRPGDQGLVCAPFVVRPRSPITRARHDLDTIDRSLISKGQRFKSSSGHFSTTWSARQ